MLHLLYILAFTTLALIALRNLIGNLLTLGIDSTRSYPPQKPNIDKNTYQYLAGSGRQAVPHPEFLDEAGNVIDEPLLVMRSMTVEDARSKLDALYNSTPESSGMEGREEN
ncbi:MAG: DUF2973 domain-containing protein [Hormoscilla sp. SP5CHS1]|nr:DUF2973 domain-containing protein [Hormoscilla sp. SP12CHS1]MBC6455082.1 DUF2973 domain-containing protein [Hormoscilla sp. SP5CHS1]